MKKVMTPQVIVIGAVMMVGSWVGNFFLNSPARAAEETKALETRVTVLTGTVSVLCNDYGQTVNRMDQNIQAIGSALKVPVVNGKTNNDPCPNINN